MRERNGDSACESRRKHERVGEIGREVGVSEREWESMREQKRDREGESRRELERVGESRKEWKRHARKGECRFGSVF